MSKKKDDDTNARLATMVAMAGGTFLLRKLLAALWTKVTGKVPPTDLSDPRVTLPEAMVWGVVTGVIFQCLRFAVARSTTRRPAADAGSQESN
jgi:hypothetical protein